MSSSAESSTVAPALTLRAQTLTYSDLLSSSPITSPNSFPFPAAEPPAHSAAATPDSWCSSSSSGALLPQRVVQAFLGRSEDKVNGTSLF